MSPSTQEGGKWDLTDTSTSSCQETWYWDSGNLTEVVMSGVRCTGTELSLDQCAHHGTHVACKRTETRFTAGVICSESECNKREMHYGLTLLATYPSP